MPTDLERKQTLALRLLSMFLCTLLLLETVRVPAPASAASETPPSAPCGTGCNGYDVVVIGSEIEGVLLAREAHAAGLSVLILDPREKPGGELIQGQMLVLDEPNDNRKRSLVQGELKPLYDGYKAGNIRKLPAFESYYRKLIREIPLRSGITIDGVEIEDTDGQGTEQRKTLKSVTYLANDGKLYQVQAGYFVENTDFNALTVHLGNLRIPGMESLYNGTKPDYMAATYMLRFKSVNWNKLHQAVLEDYPLTNVVKKYGANTYVDWDFATGFSNLTYNYRPRDSHLMLRGLNATYQKDGEVIINSLLVYDVDPADPQSVRSAVARAKAEAPYIAKYLRKHIPGFGKAELNGYPDYLYIRDYNRYETDYVLNYKDVMSGRMFWDNVTVGGYTVDLQATRVVKKGIGYGKPDRYGIPLRSFELKSYDNVLVAGKNIGAEIKAYGSARIIPTTALAGETMGILLGREWKQGHKRLSELTPGDFRRIHRYLKKDYDIRIDQ
ncbi:FAD-dependent oxidoreductase [Paenibacillus sp. DXFW5]|uniref:FAD-dependent oxidoreductase n=1 Tax=Paenibacillus rhizolycopersici TaxID=2780073 RepID=A0ABS2H5Y8_9BACL|nr:FAD-dependent oxidoreductase [Paenibacillus rhizolycopersici]MBM6996211.1 FAD-dependent oxidoreductase [Paenibacillus rhizolycopersici]